MNEIKQSLVYATKANDVDEKGVVTVAVNGIGIEDTQHDISMPGSFDKTMKSDIGRMRWFLNHDVTQLLGVPLEGGEKDGNLVMRGKLNLDKQIARDIKADYELYAANGRTLEHSIGVQALKRDNADKRRVLEWKMFEYSTLTHWGSNPQTFLVNIKSATREQVEDAIAFIRQAFKMRGYSDERLKNYDMELELLLKSLNGDAVVGCPRCGHKFEYDAHEEKSFSELALEKATCFPQWVKDGKVEEEMAKLDPQTKSEIGLVLDKMDLFGARGTEKSAQEISHHVCCPICGCPVSKSMTLMQQPIEVKADEEPEAAKDFWASMNECI